MSKNRNRSKLDRACCSNEYRKIWLNQLYPMYWDEGVYFYPRYRKGFRNPNRSLEMYKVRMYKTWKHNRKTRWKNF